MGRSYLYGRDTKTLSSAEYELEKLYDQVDREGYRLTPQQFFKSPEYAQWLDRSYGSLMDQVPPGSQIINQSPFKLEYRDAEGYTHTLTRGGTSGGELGTVSRQTDRPAILPNQRQNSMLDFLQGRVQQGLGPVGLAELDPQTASALAAIQAARRAELDRTIADDEGRLVAALYGNRVNQSSIANEAAGRFAEGAGRLRLQEGADAANRELAIRQLLTTLRQQQNEGAANLYANLTGQGTQRDIAGAGLDVDLQKLLEASRQFNLGDYRSQQQLAQRQQELDAANSPLNKALKISQIAANLMSGGATAFSAYNALAGPGNVPRPATPPYFPSTQYPSYYIPTWPTPR